MSRRILVIVLLLVNACIAWAATPDRLGYQGNLADSGGNPITANLSITFRLYDVASGGSALWTETQGAVAVARAGLAQARTQLALARVEAARYGALVDGGMASQQETAARRGQAAGAAARRRGRARGRARRRPAANLETGG